MIGTSLNKERHIITISAKTNYDIAIYPKCKKKAWGFGLLTYHVMFSALEPMAHFLTEKKPCVFGMEQNLNCENL